MKFSSITIVLSSLLIAAKGVPAPGPNPGVSPARISYLASRDSINNCGASSFTGETSGGSPKVDDCRTIVKNISGGGTWDVALISEHQLVQFGTCAFAVQANFQFPILLGFNVGNQDIMDLINDSITKFQSNGLVGARGDMTCQDLGDDGATVPVHWRIFHT